MWYQKFEDGETRSTGVADMDGADDAATDASSWSADYEDSRHWELEWSDE